MSDLRRREPGAAQRWALSLLLMAGTAGCSASPRYPINLGERPGDGSIMATPPRYPASAADAAQDARNRASQQGYPDYNAAPVAPASAQAYAPPVAPAQPAADADNDDSAPPASMKDSGVESSDLPPPNAAPPAATPDDGGTATPHTISWGGGQIVFGTESVDAPVIEFAAYRHRRHHAAEAKADDASDSDAKPARSTRHHRGSKSADASDDTTADAPAASGGVVDTPYQTVVRPGEKLGDVAERVHSSKEALTALNGLKHPRRVKAGTVLKIPYRYAYEVQKGDTLYTISHRFNQDPQAIAKLNGLKTVPTLQPGQTLSLPTDVSDNGKRDHAAAAGPTPMAAPDKMADAALAKAERRDRRHRRSTEPAEATVAEAAATAPAAEPPAHETRRQRLRREREEAKATRLAAAEARRAPVRTESPSLASPATEVAADSRALRPSPEPVRPTYAPLRPSPEPAPVESASASPLRPSPEPVPSAPVATAQAARAPSFVPPAASTPAYAAPGYATATRAPALAAPASSQPYYAGVRPSTGAYAGGQQVASLTQPRYTPGSPSGAYEPSLGRVRPTAPVASAGPVSSSEVATAGRGRFIWPLHGQVVSGFGAKGEGQHNDGVDIAVAPGTSVRAAAAGEVVYAGSSIPGFGNLVLVKHAGGWVTAYAHLDRIEVRMRDSVTQGEEIGQSGQTGAVDRPLLHFEVRYAPDPTERARPVDPTLVLPAG